MLSLFNVGIKNMKEQYIDAILLTEDRKMAFCDVTEVVREEKTGEVGCVTVNYTQGRLDGKEHAKDVLVKHNQVDVQLGDDYISFSNN